MPEGPVDPAPIAIAYSDSGRSRPRGSGLDTPIVGYVIDPQIIPTRRIGLGFPAGPVSPLLGQVNRYEIPVSVSTATTMSTATVTEVAPFDSAFLQGTDFFPVDVQELKGSKADKGNAVYDAMAYGSLLHRLEVEDIGGPVVVRTDGALPEWLAGTKALTLDVHGKNIWPELRSNLLDLQGKVEEVRHENFRGDDNLADSGPLSELKKQLRIDARQLARRVA